jgi:lipopolysaccharide transport system ATP-binding protein
MGDVAQQGRTVLFVSHNMSAILRLTEEALVLNKGQLIMRGPTQQAVDFYLSSGQAQAGERIWETDEVPPNAAPFRPIAMRLKDQKGKVIDTVRSTEPVTVELEYRLDSPLTGLRVGFYLSTMRGEYIITSFDVDEGEQYEKFGSRSNGHYVSRAILPADLFNEGRYMLGMNASSFGVRRYFMDENAWPSTWIFPGRPARNGPNRARALSAHAWIGRSRKMNRKVDGYTGNRVNFLVYLFPCPPV